ncbi:aminotransferase-like domain-containing protein [Oceanirhabdus sp. W0125-5]|uniref:aminotransferase-like domain-containing protein n=1 Tax=Oceanirhabdus sp. W0125-5 TaxID=2999116 RepID=UPI0022F2C866|nr:PLP-dependent aminotransferase family protein [Oceanirhabdus sp. W0125-5]WBW95106.1 PLP-dependent aminotransferase family protein [Oceanirhabdus sp. W0125-5]
MELRYSDRASYVKASEIRELLKLTQRPEVISFAGGLPAPELFPLEQINKVMNKVILEDGHAALQYATTEGYNPLRKIIAEQRMQPNRIDCTYENIMITNGSQQGLEFSGKLFLNEGDIVMCESPSYLGAINAFKIYNPKFVEIPMDENGMIIEELEKALEKYPETKMIYTIPDFQNPSGKTMSLERRKKLAEIANEKKIPVIEDSPYGELRFEGEKLPCIKHFDAEGYVITLGSFSKTFCPGLRIGWVCAHKDIVNKYVLIKQGADLQASSVSQIAAARFMEEYDLNDHIQKIISVYKKRRDLMLDSMKKYFPAEVKYTYPEGGLFTWVELREDLDSREINMEALEVNVAFVPGGSFFPNGGNNNTFRLNYSTMPEDKIVEGIKRLGEVLKRHY